MSGNLCANIITADTNVITMGINVIATGSSVISGNNIRCPRVLAIYHKVDDYHPWSQKLRDTGLRYENRPRKTCAGLKIDQ